MDKLHTSNNARVNGGRSAARLAALLRAEIAEGGIASGEFLSTERQLAAEHGMARMTVRRALKALESEGLIAAEPRHGYRVLARAADPDKGFPIAYVLSSQNGATSLDPLHQMILGAFQRAANRRGWSLLGVSSEGRPQGEVMEQLRAARVCGVALDTVNRDLLRLVHEVGMPAVMVDAWLEDAPFDLVLQDNYRGAFLAAQYLVKRGHQRIAWLGPVGATGHSRARFGGAVAGLVGAGRELPPELRIEAGDANARQRAGELLDRPDRPTGILALWRATSLQLAAAAAERGLLLGRDLDIVGWSPEEEYADYCDAAREHGPVPAAVVWSVEHMARMAMSRLAERREDPDMPPMRISVPTGLRLPEEEK